MGAQLFNLALAPIWPIWQHGQSGNLTTESIWRANTKRPWFKTKGVATLKIDKTDDGQGIRLAGECQIEPYQVGVRLDIKRPPIRLAFQSDQLAFDWPDIYIYILFP